MDLVIDIGNTFQKIGIFSDNEEMVDFYQFEDIETSHLESIFQKYPIQHSIISSVAKNSTEIENFLGTHSLLIPFSHRSLLPVKLCYDQPETLGLDRIANAVGAYSAYPEKNILSIQAGSCLVYDFVDSNGNYRGGAISPGIEMRFKSLHHFTKRLPLIEKREIDFFVGRSTQQSIESGVINGVKNEICGFIAQYEETFGELIVLLSGGDSHYLQNSIKNTIFVGSNFILRGLHKILKLNVKKT